jgi:hypothetical protein
MTYAVRLATREVIEVGDGLQALADSLCIQTEEEAEALILYETGADILIYDATSKEEALAKALAKSGIN